MRVGLIWGVLAIAGGVCGQTPDIQGVWLSNSATPLERPKALEGRTALTDEEVAELKKRAARLFKDGTSDYAAGDAAFLAALNNVERYQSATSTDRSSYMVEREFDNRTSLITDPPDGRIPPLTAEAQKRRAAAAALRRPPQGPEDLNPAERCLTFGGVPRLGGNFGAGPYAYYEIIQAPGYVVLFSEAIHEARIIPLDSPLDKRPHLPQNIRSWTGDSTGRWDGKTLVVDTTNLPLRNAFMGAGPRLRVIEKFTRVSNDRLNYEVTVNDPDTWTKPWTAMLPLMRSDEKMFEFACHEGNATVMKGMLEGGQ